MKQNQNGREEIPQTIEEHIDLMTRRYLETGNVFACLLFMGQRTVSAVTYAKS